MVVEKKSVEKHASESVKNRGNERRKDNYNENRDRDKEKRRNDHERGRDIVFKDKLAKRRFVRPKFETFANYVFQSEQVPA